MRCLLLGANGQLSQDIRRQAERSSSGIELQPLTRKDIDVTDIEAIADVLGAADFDVLINGTAYNLTDKAESEAALAIAVNGQAVGALAGVCQAKGARLVHISTDYVFGGGEAGKPLCETDPPAPVNVYGISKFLGEQLAFARHDDVLVPDLFEQATSGGAHGTASPRMKSSSN